MITERDRRLRQLSLSSKSQKGIHLFGGFVSMCHPDQKSYFLLQKIVFLADK